MRPDITDVSDRVLLEIKPDSKQGLQEGREQARRYLEALNRAVVSGDQFTGGTDFEGTILIHFKGGRYVWELRWHTPEPGVTLYRWRRSQDRHDSFEQAEQAQAWVELSKQEYQQHERLLEQLMESLLLKRPIPREACSELTVVGICP